MSDIKELNDEELDKVAGGIGPEKVYDVKENVLYKSKSNNTDYAYVTSFIGVSVAKLQFYQGTMLTDCKVHKSNNDIRHWTYSAFKQSYDVNSTLTSDYWIG